MYPFCLTPLFFILGHQRIDDCNVQDCFLEMVQISQRWSSGSFFGCLRVLPPPFSNFNVIPWDVDLHLETGLNALSSPQFSSILYHLKCRVQFGEEAWKQDTTEKEKARKKRKGRRRRRKIKRVSLNPHKWYTSPREGIIHSSILMTLSPFSLMSRSRHGYCCLETARDFFVTFYFSWKTFCLEGLFCNFWK